MEKISGDVELSFDSGSPTALIRLIGRADVLVDGSSWIRTYTVGVWRLELSVKVMCLKKQ